MYNKGRYKQWKAMKGNKVVGIYKKNLDEKNRIVIPSALREKLGDTFYISFGFYENLELRSEKEFTKMIEKLEKANQLNEDFRKLKRLFTMNSSQLTVDKLGRVTLPSNLLEMANIKKNISFVGVGSICEIWPEQQLNEEVTKLNNKDSKSELLKKVSEAGIEI